MQERNVHHGEIAVRDVMTPADRLEILELWEVERARVGDVVATLKVAGRQHALVVETTDQAQTVQRSVCGIFSLTQIARQLGIPPQQIHDNVKWPGRLDREYVGALSAGSQPKHR